METSAVPVPSEGIARSLDEDQLPIREVDNKLEQPYKTNNREMHNNTACESDDEYMISVIDPKTVTNEITTQHRTLLDTGIGNDTEMIMQIDDDTVSLDTVQDSVDTSRKEMKLSYSQVASRGLWRISYRQIIDELEQQWKNALCEAFKSSEKLSTLIKEKYNTAPIDSSLPAAIDKKIEYRNTAFFRSFTRKAAIKPMHQIEFETLLNKAIDKYKKQYKVFVIHKINREQIFAKLRLKLASEFLLGLNFQKLEAGSIARYLIYLVNFSKIDTTLYLEDIAKLCRAVEAMQIEDLLGNSMEIAPQIRDTMPFQLPIKNRTQAAPIARIPNPLLEQYIGINYTELPNLSRNHREVSEVNLKISITTRKQLTIATQALRPFYFFHQLLTSWLELGEDEKKLKIRKSNTLNALPPLLDMLEEFLEEIKRNDQEEGTRVPVGPSNTTHAQRQEEDTQMDNTDAQVTEPIITKDNECESQH
ncbi:12635_t:CDS:2 [Gigaspora margarita]|uniref:12635_t:CDS:1 n=1 Tax=Gigaspora margarita TaxID=4874 RepID=A0ABM8W3Q3_GIGMA|nr:12635_t:CDS:2 [Gigaspora margarita]